MGPLNGIERALATWAARACIAVGVAACIGEAAEEREETPPPCTGGRHVLIEDLTLEEPMDYVGDYGLGTLIASIGSPCARAPHADRCATAFDAAVSTNDRL